MHAVVRDWRVACPPQLVWQYSHGARRRAALAPQVSAKGAELSHKSSRRPKCSLPLRVPAVAVQGRPQDSRKRRGAAWRTSAAGRFSRRSCGGQRRHGSAASRRLSFWRSVQSAALAVLSHRSPPFTDAALTTLAVFAVSTFKRMGRHRRAKPKAGVFLFLLAATG